MRGLIAPFLAVAPQTGEGISCACDRGLGDEPGDDSHVESPEPMENIEHPTSNTERRSERGFALSFDVLRWMFDVGCSSGFMESPGPIRIAAGVGGQPRGIFYSS